MKKLIVFTIVVVGICFAVVVWKFKSHPVASQEGIRNQDGQTASAESPNDATDGTADGQKPLVVSDEELARLKLLNLVSEDGNYYIKSGKPFPSVVDLHTGDEYLFKPASNYLEVTNLQWSPDGQTLSYLYEVGDAGYAGNYLLNTSKIAEVINKKFPNAGRVLASGGNMNYVWRDSDRILYYQLLVFDAANHYYKNGSIGIYNVRTEKFNSPWVDANGKVEYIPNVYSMQIAPTKDAVLATEAVLDANGNTVGQQYVARDLAGNIINSSDAYEPDWYK